MSGNLRKILHTHVVNRLKRLIIMEKAECPHCGEATITARLRFRAGKWLDIYCPKCGGRSCAQPIVLAIMYFMHVWNLAFFGFMAVYESSWIYFSIMVVLSLILEFFIMFIPLSRMRKKSQRK